MFMDMIHFTILDTRPMIEILHPMEGALIYSDDIHLEVDIMNFTLNGSAIGGNNIAGEGHFHVYINGTLIGPYNETMITLSDLPAGDHELAVHLVNNDHNHLYPEVMDVVHFTISDLRPSINLNKPVDGSYFYSTDLEVDVAISDLLMNASAIGGNNSIGEGHWHLYINDDLIGPYTDGVVMLSDLPLGTHEIKIVLVNNDHTPIIPMTYATATFHLLEAPTINIVSPANGTVIDGTSLELEVEVDNFELNSTMIGGSNAPGQGHYHIYVNDDLVGPYTDLMVTLSDLPAGDHVLMVELRNNDHSAIGIEAMDMIYFSISISPEDINVTFGPVTYDGEPLEGTEVEIKYDNVSYTGTTDEMGMVYFTVPAEWDAMTVDFKVIKDGYDDLTGTGLIVDGAISVSDDIELEKEDDDDTDPTIWIILIVLAIIVVIGLFIVLRPKDKQEDYYEE
jgi:hypothetical protein